MRLVQRPARLAKQMDGTLGRQRPMPFHQLVQVQSRQVFHRVVEQTFLHARFIKLDDVGMAELAEDLDFPLEAFEKAGFLGQFRGQHLELGAEGVFRSALVGPQRRQEREVSEDEEEGTVLQR